jgi:tetratricopeptide (TPR) repeat protein
MLKQKNIANLYDKTPQIKGFFKGNFIAQKNRKLFSKNKYQNIEIIDGIINASQDEPKYGGHPNLFDSQAASRSFSIQASSDIVIKLERLDSTFDTFTAQLDRIVLLNCQLVEAFEKEGKIYGRLEGDIVNYSLSKEITTRKREDRLVKASVHSAQIPFKKHDGTVQVNIKTNTPIITPTKKRSSLGFLIFTGILFYVIFLVVENKYPESKTTAGKHESQMAPSAIQSDFTKYYELAKKFLQQNKAEEALAAFEKAKMYASNDDKAKLQKESKQMYVSIAEVTFKNGRHTEALEMYSKLATDYSDNAHFFYQKATCYIKLGKIKEAVRELKKAMKLGDKTATWLYDTINPQKKRIAYYITRCCDGTVSHSTGSGACSHHGGVCDWNEPVYESYRDY